ncbi:MAG: hypothetical protein IKZ56_13375 [Bacteroidales bacterium]|nr:hypothetical protein [Bacteroidales bacterium]MBR5922143.1 hypothetical protein [Bacteroidales bacterium]
MKNFYIQTIVLFFVVLAGFTSKTNAQFASSNELYCYQYEKTIEDGVMIKETPDGPKAHYDVLFVVFQDNVVGCKSEKYATTAKSKYASDPNYYKNAALSIIKNNREWEERPNEMRYNASLTTESKITYTEWNFKSCSGAFGWKAGWSEYCYSFSRDKAEMIIWRTDKPQRRAYYKLVDPNSLKSDFDFLD